MPHLYDLNPKLKGSKKPKPVKEEKKDEGSKKRGRPKKEK